MEDKDMKGVLGFARKWEGCSAAISIMDRNSNREKTFFHETAHTQIHVNDEEFSPVILQLLEESSSFNVRIEEMVKDTTKLPAGLDTGIIKTHFSNMFVTIVAELEAECTAFLLISSLEYPGSEYSLQYIKNFSRQLRRAPFDYKEYAEKMINRIISAAETILKAGLYEVN